MDLTVSNSNIATTLANYEVWDLTLPWLPDWWDSDTLRRFKQAGYNYLSLTIQDNLPPTFEGTLDTIRRYKELIEAESSWVTFGDSTKSIGDDIGQDKLVLGLNLQETILIGMDLSRIQLLHDAGIRHMVLAYNIRNFVADGCAEADNAGLSNFGRQVVKEMNRVGIIIDGSHTGRRSSLEAIELSERPSIFSHCGAYKVCAHIRNIHDDQIRACASSGGVIGVLGLGNCLGDLTAKSESVFRHIDYVVNLVGPDHVGLGSDYVPQFFYDKTTTRPSPQWGKKPWPDPAIGWTNPTGTQLPRGEGTCFQPEQLTELVEIMVAHGYPPSAIKGILGGNFQRVYKAFF